MIKSKKQIAFDHKKRNVDIPSPSVQHNKHRINSHLSMLPTSNRFKLYQANIDRAAVHHTLLYSMFQIHVMNSVKQLL
jgi:hypothetical protein